MSIKILVVDDDPKITVLLYRFLIKEGFEVLTATDGEEALRIAQDNDIDLIVLDISMPGMDGSDVMARMMMDVRMQNIPVVILTGLVSQEECDTYNEKYPGRRVISKSLDITEQVNIIKETLEVY